jgi:6-pyruvoyltetrahydropterin/6-carboxytetrahydropterin synthase
MFAELTKQFKFEAAHCLPNHDGKCRGVHGHSYVVVVTLDGIVKPADGSPDEGMVIDFACVKEAWQKIEPMLDHQDLNLTIGPVIGPTTAENIAGWILNQMEAEILPGLEPGRDTYIKSVTVFETATSSATVGA